MDKTCILVVDDEKDVCDLIKSMLEIKGYNVLTASSGEDALKEAVVAQPDLILLDILLPDMDGFEVLHRLRHNLRTEQIPVVIVSAKRDTESLFKAKKYRSNDFISKPFTSEELLKIVAKCLSFFRPNLKRLDPGPNVRIQDKLQPAETALYLLSQNKEVPKDFIDRARKDLDEAIRLLDSKYS